MLRSIYEKLLAKYEATLEKFGGIVKKLDFISRKMMKNFYNFCEIYFKIIHNFFPTC